MNYEYTPALARAIVGAQDIARAAGSDAVLPEHLLRALLGEDEGLAASLLRRCGLQELPNWSGPSESDTISEETMLPLGSGIEHVLARARGISAELSAERTLTSDQVLLAVLLLETPLRQGLEKSGFQMEQLRQAVYSVGGPPLQLDEPLALFEDHEQIDTARIVDAAANRAREALRVIEDYCRFALDDALLSRELKELRHRLTERLSPFSSNALLAARDTRGDVGTTLTSTGEQQRASLRAVVQANLKRLQEALRSLEEFGKLHSPDLGAAFEQERYHVYTLEKAILGGASARERLAEVRLCVLLTGARCAAAIDWTIAEAAAGGASMFQLREKSLSDRELIARAREVRAWTRQAGALFIVNDRPDIARLVEADGVHLGQDDLPVKEARRIAGGDALIGVSTHSLAQLRAAVLDGADYVGIGPTFSSKTKEFEELAGLDFVRQAAAETSLPAFVIGGVNEKTIAAAVQAGARRVAVSEAICAADEPRQAAAVLRAALNGAQEPASH